MDWTTGVRFWAQTFVLASMSRLPLDPTWPTLNESWELFPQVNQLECEADHSFPSNVKFKNAWSTAFIPRI
jgi:hypothetical protein